LRCCGRVCGKWSKPLTAGEKTRAYFRGRGKEGADITVIAGEGRCMHSYGDKGRSATVLQAGKKKKKCHYKEKQRESVSLTSRRFERRDNLVYKSARKEFR